MKLNRISILAVLIPVLFSCEINNREPEFKQDLLTRSWINPVSNDSIISYSRSDSLITQEYGFTFKPDRTFIERKNAGWCGTPPIYYADFEGIWSREDSIIYITVGYWGGTVDYEWKIVALDEEKLDIIPLSHNYKHENRYYDSEIFDWAYLDIYGEWVLKSVSGGIHGGGHELNFDIMEISRIGQYRFLKENNTIERGKIIIQEQDAATLRISLEADPGSGIILHDSEKFVSLNGVDTLDLNAPCCDRFNYHFARKD